MSKSVSIQQDGTPATYGGVSVINTPTMAGGRTDWVPEDETEVAEFTVTANGTYDLSNYGYFGAYRVNVLVAGGAGAVIDGPVPIENGVPTIDNPTVESQYVDAGPSVGRIVGVDPETGRQVLIGVDDDGYIYIEPYVV